MRPYPRATRRVLWLSFTPDALNIRRITSDRFEEVGRVDLAGNDRSAQKLAFVAALGKRRRQALGIVVPRDLVLRKTIVVPEAARDNLAQVVGFELPRHTPFNAEQAYFDHVLYEIDEKDRKSVV
jgi:general secretion pathway protein L